MSNIDDLLEKGIFTFNTGVEYHEPNFITSSISIFDNIIDKDPENAVAYRYRAKASLRVGNVNGAIKDYNTAILINPKKSSYYFELAQIDFHLEDNTMALKHVNYAIKLDKNNHKQYFLRAKISEELNNSIDIIANYEKAFLLHPTKKYNRFFENAKYELEELINYIDFSLEEIELEFKKENLN